MHFRASQRLYHPRDVQDPCQRVFFDAVHLGTIFYARCVMTLRHVCRGKPTIETFYCLLCYEVFVGTPSLLCYAMGFSGYTIA